LAFDLLLQIRCQVQASFSVKDGPGNPAGCVRSATQAEREPHSPRERPTGCRRGGAMGSQRVPEPKKQLNFQLLDILKPLTL
jgi:hypothetical protein